MSQGTQNGRENMNDRQLNDWIILQMVGIEMLDKHWPASAAHVRLGVELQRAIRRGDATDIDYDNFERFHPVIVPSNIRFQDLPCWMR